MANSNDGDIPENPYIALRKEWIAWHKEHPDVWELFHEYSWHIVARGLKRASAQLTMGRVKWELIVERHEHHTAIPTKYIPFYVKLWIRTAPSHPIYKNGPLPGEEAARLDALRQTSFL